VRFINGWGYFTMTLTFYICRTKNNYLYEERGEDYEKSGICTYKHDVKDDGICLVGVY